MNLSTLIRPVLFLVGTAAILLVTDLDNRETNKVETKQFRLAIYKFTSNPILDWTEEGVLETLKNTSHYKNKQIEITAYNSEGDMPTANMIAMTIVNAKYDMVLTISTPALQVMANANKEGAINHVFCAVTDPYGSGVGIIGSGISEHPEHMVGIGSFQPVEETFRIAKQMRPELSKVGVVWCTSQTCSEACVVKARKICKELNIELLEAGIESSIQVYETAISMTQKGVEALWIGGDNIVESAIDMYIEAGKKAHIPVITNTPADVDKGTFMNLGADYHEVGVLGANLAYKIIQGTATNNIGVENIVPEALTINEAIINTFRHKWTIPDNIRERADRIVK